MSRFEGHSEYKFRKKTREDIRFKWTSYFIERYGATPFCEICGRELAWGGYDKRINVVHFDHKTRLVPIQSASLWITTHACNADNIAIWEKCDFGILCNICNINLITENRIEWLEKALKYAKKHN